MAQEATMKEIYNSDRLYDMDYIDGIEYTEKSLNQIRYAMHKTNKGVKAIKINTFDNNNNKITVGMLGIKQDLLAYIANEHTGKIVITQYNKNIFANIFYTHRGEWHRFELEPVA